MPYTQEQAMKDQAEMLQMAEQFTQEGDHLRAGIMRAEAGNCLDRVGMRKAHRPNLGPYTDGQVQFCVDCGKLQAYWRPDNVDECIPAETP